MEDDLTQIGLTPLQSKVYLHLLDYSHGRKPSQVAECLGLTRTNAYKILDQLCAYDLAHKSEVGRTYRYFAEDPIALAGFVSRARNHARDLEKQVKDSMGKLRDKYQRKVLHSEINIAYGKAALLQAYSDQTKKRSNIHFVKTRMDIPFMGFETMARIRSEPTALGIQRYGITPATPEMTLDSESDTRNNLTRTLIPQSNYVSPVEWTVSDDVLTIVNFTKKGSVIRIRDHIIADAFRKYGS